MVILVHDVLVDARGYVLYPGAMDMHSIFDICRTFSDNREEYFPGGHKSPYPFSGEISIDDRVHVYVRTCGLITLDVR